MMTFSIILSAYLKRFVAVLSVGRGVTTTPLWNRISDLRQRDGGLGHPALPGRQHRSDSPFTALKVTTVLD